VTVCIEPYQSVPLGVRPLVSEMFASIGVSVDWRVWDACPAGVGAIRVRLSDSSPSMPNSEALAVARPYEGSIVVFLDRVREELNRHRGPSVIAHVLVHEITHVLEGINWHSDTGIMKARWNSNDYGEMCHKPLPFAEEDVGLIYDGLKVRRAAVARQ